MTKHFLIINWSSVFYIVIDYRGHHWKVMAIYNETEVILWQKRFLIIRNVFFEHGGKVKTINSLYNYIFSIVLRAALYMLIFENINMHCSI